MILDGALDKATEATLGSRLGISARHLRRLFAAHLGVTSFFQVRVGRATKAELAYLAAMASLGAGPYRSGEIAAALGRPGPESVAPTRA